MKKTDSFAGLVLSRVQTHGWTSNSTNGKQKSIRFLSYKNMRRSLGGVGRRVGGGRAGRPPPTPPPRAGGAPLALGGGGGGRRPGRPPPRPPAPTVPPRCGTAVKMCDGCVAVLARHQSVLRRTRACLRPVLALPHFSLPHPPLSPAGGNRYALLYHCRQG